VRTMSINALRREGCWHVPGASGGQCDWGAVGMEENKGGRRGGGQSRQGLCFVVRNMDVILCVKANFCGVLNWKIV